MNLKLAIASTLLAIAVPASALAAVPPVKVGSVTFALVHTTYIEDHKVTPSDKLEKEVYKYTNVKSKYGNKEFIADLITKGVLTGAVADWSLKFVDVDDDEFQGFFALNKSGTAVYLSSSVIDSDFIGGYAFSGTYNYTTTIKDGVDQISKENTSWKETDKVELYLSPLSGINLILTAFRNFGYSYNEVYNEVTDTLVSESYSLSASSFDSIVGHDDNHSQNGIISGSIKISAMKDAADPTVYLNAIP
jgi:hypothetical protein